MWEDRNVMFGVFAKWTFAGFLVFAILHGGKLISGLNAGGDAAISSLIEMLAFSGVFGAIAVAVAIMRSKWRKAP